jgi:hypothetical protein
MPISFLFFFIPFSISGLSTVYSSVDDREPDSAVLPSTGIECIN